MKTLGEVGIALWAEVEAGVRVQSQARMQGEVLAWVQGREQAGVLVRVQVQLWIQVQTEKTWAKTIQTVMVKETGWWTEPHVGLRVAQHQTGTEIQVQTKAMVCSGHAMWRQRSQTMMEEEEETEM